MVRVRADGEVAALPRPAIVISWNHEKDNRDIKEKARTCSDRKGRAYRRAHAAAVAGGAGRLDQQAKPALPEPP